MNDILNPSKTDFVHLHIHTHYSLLDGLQKVPELLGRVEALGQKAVAITDHGTMSGVIEFYKMCKKRSIKPLIGMEAYMSPRSHQDKTAGIDRDPYHLILLAQNRQGYKNLMKLSTIACLDGFYYKPRLDKDLLKKYHEGLICLSGCAASELSSAILADDTKKSEEIAAWFAETFGRDNYYLEMQPHTEWEKQIKINDGVRALSQKLGLGTVITGDAHYAKEDDHGPHDILLCVQTGSVLDDPNRMRLDMDLSVHSGDEILAKFPNDHQALANTVKIANMSELEIELGKILIPTFLVPQEETEKTYLRKLVFEGAGWRYAHLSREEAKKKNEEEIKKILEQKIIDRIEYELEVIGKMEYEGYFLIVADLINWSKDRGIICGPGRGSAAGSIVAYLTNITDLDPLKYDLLFERFLNPDRISMPDIDMDFADDRRDEVIKYATEKYGQDRVAQIITFGVMAARNAVRDTGRVLGMPYAEVDAIAKLIPAPVQGKHTSLSQSIIEDPTLSKEYNTNSRAKNLINIAMQLEGTIRNAGVHAAGVVISKDPIVEHAPLVRAQKGGIATQYSMGPIEDIGLLKFDFLGLANLTIIKNTLRIIKKAYEINIDIADIPIDDRATYELLSRGETTGVFQLESDGMKRYIKELRPNQFEDIIAMVALYRPGPMQWIEDFIKRKHNSDLITYGHPKMEASLKNTYGIIVYQEQVIQISKDLCGFTGGQADTMRRAIGKKKIETMTKMKEAFVAGAIEHSGAKKDFVENLWKSLEDFAAYCFNKSHAACYALIAVQTAYLKAHYPEAFMAALMTSDKNDLDRIAKEIDECRSIGIKVLPPDVNESFTTFAVVPGKKEIRYALSAIKNVGEGPIEAIENSRREKGAFKSLEDFIERTATSDVNKKTIESLIKSGAMDIFGERNQLLASLDNILQYAQNVRKNVGSNQINIFGETADRALLDTIKLEIVEKASEKQKLDWEKELLGIYVSGHPMDPFREIAKNFFPAISSISNDLDGKEIKIIGSISLIHKITTRNKEPMLFVTVEDFSGQLELIVFPKKLIEKPGFWTEGKVIIVSGKISNKDGSAKILVNEFEDFTPSLLDLYNKEMIKIGQEEKQILEISFNDKLMLDDLNRLKKVFMQNSGETAVILKLIGPNGLKKIKTSFKVRFDEEIKNEIKKSLGQNPEYTVVDLPVH
ncbi:DNA polymerase III subunit alpha [Candidatus Microgenomates bacterium]|nr:DNA polymerase III subunit alpha [Candidatus Microgenomates bacterium]